MVTVAAARNRMQPEKMEEGSGGTISGLIFSGRAARAGPCGSRAWENLALFTPVRRGWESWNVEQPDSSPCLPPPPIQEVGNTS